MSELDREAAKDPAVHKHGCQCWPHISWRDATDRAVEAARLEYREGVKARRAEAASPSLRSALEDLLAHHDNYGRLLDGPKPCVLSKAARRALAATPEAPGLDVEAATAGDTADLTDCIALLHDLRQAVEEMDRRLTPHGEREEDGTTAHYIVADSTWHRVLAAARRTASDLPHVAYEYGAAGRGLNYAATPEHRMSADPVAALHAADVGGCHSVELPGHLPPEPHDFDFTDAEALLAALSRTEP